MFATHAYLPSCLVRCLTAVAVLTTLVSMASCSDEGGAQADVIQDAVSDADTARDSAADDTTTADVLEDTSTPQDTQQTTDATQDTGSDITAADGADTLVDATVSSCDDIAASSCLANPDCGATERCTSYSDTLELRCCVAGARGAGEAGASCTADDACALGRCMVRDDGAAFCSGVCGGDLDCPGFMFCSSIFGWCVPRDADWVPSSCSQVDLTQCFYNDNCQDPQRCENVGSAADEVLCCTDGARGTGQLGDACTTELECAFGRCIGGLCSEVCDLGADPCPAPQMECNLLRGLCEPAP